MASLEKLLTAEALAKFLDVTPKTVYRKAADGELPCYRWGSTVRFSLAEVLEAGRGTPIEAKASPKEANARSKKVASSRSKKVASVQLDEAPGGGKVTRLPGSR